MKRRPHLHDDTVTIDPGKKNLLEIPPSCSEPPDDKLTSNTTITSN